MARPVCKGKQQKKEKTSTPRDERREARRKRTRRKEPGSACLTAVCLPLSLSLSLPCPVSAHRPRARPPRLSGKPWCEPLTVTKVSTYKRGLIPRAARGNSRIPTWESACVVNYANDDRAVDRACWSRATLRKGEGRVAECKLNFRGEDL